MPRDLDLRNNLERPTALGDNNNTIKKRLITDGGPDTDIEILTTPPLPPHLKVDSPNRLQNILIAQLTGSVPESLQVQT